MPNKEYELYNISRTKQGIKQSPLESLISEGFAMSGQTHFC